MEVGGRNKTNEKSEAEKENDCIINIVDTIDPVVESIDGILGQAASSNSSDYSIYRVPETLRNMKQEAYSPTLISIGPFHSGRKDLKAGNTTVRVEESLRRKLEQDIPSNSSNVSIYRVPETLRNMKPEAYSPTLISIGPFHSGKIDLTGNSYKTIYLQNFLHLTKLNLYAIVERVEGLEERVRCCYPDQSINMTRDEFLQLLVLDGCFVVIYLIVSEFLDLQTSNSLNLGKFWDEIFCDLLLLENQLPFFLLESLYDLFTSSVPLPEEMSFLELARSFIENYNEEGLNFLAEKECFADTNEGKVNHFVDLLKLHFTREACYFYKTSFFQRTCWPPTATALYQCGVIFRRGKEEKKCALNVVFITGGYLELPLMIIDDGFETRVRNLMAYEQCHANDDMKDNVVRNFAFFMQCLVQTDQDVKLLIEHGILENNFGSLKEVTQIFNSLCKHGDPGINFYHPECKKMKDYCKRRRHLWMTTLRRNDFSTPWTCASSIAAILLLALTLVQTVGTLVQVKFFGPN